MAEAEEAHEEEAHEEAAHEEAHEEEHEEDTSGSSSSEDAADEGDAGDKEAAPVDEKAEAVLRLLIEALNSKGIDWWSLWNNPEAALQAVKEEGSSSSSDSAADEDAGSGESSAAVASPAPAPGIEGDATVPGAPQPKKGKGELVLGSAENPYAELGEQEAGTIHVGGSVLNSAQCQAEKTD
ncbi:uncharacterized protein LOC135370875 isoform X9 [Ornithodoros turicata]|uniref:uncharacterized protein LOC135370875 isoform X9 n=1 Tax=Ornithodoros turicata TaxID=34597 RepID=UPI003138717C